MGAPTWPPTPEEGDRATLDEYGDQAKAVLAARAAETDEEAERALLAPFLFGAPRRLLSDGKEAGTALASLGRALGGWMRMISGLNVELAIADPPATDGRAVFLPRALPGPPSPAEDALLYRVMGLHQLGLLAFGLLEGRALLGELHQDWVLRNTWHLLAARVVTRRWIALWPGLRADLEGARLLPRARALRVNHTAVPRAGLPEPFAVLLEGLSEEGPLRDLTRGLEAASQAAREACARIDALDPLADPAVLRLTLLGQASALRLRLREARLGAPPLPAMIGILRPEWILDDLARDRRAEEAWREGPAPLRMLRELGKRQQEQSGARAKVTGALRAALGRPEAAPPPSPSLLQDEARPRDEEGQRYDEWDERAQGFRAGAVRVVEVDAPAGDRESWDRLCLAQEGALREVRRRFTALRIDERWEHGRDDGPELDLDRAIRATVDLRAGWSPPRVDWYARYVRQRRDLAVMVMVDLSGSVHGGVLYREQEAIVVLAEGLRALGLPHAFYGFSGEGAESCRVQRIKGWEDSYDEGTRRRLAGLRAGGATRLGAFLRHATWALLRRPQGRRLLLLVSDGRPEDRDGYRGDYGLADSVVAASEARRQGIVLHCTSFATRDGAESWLRPVFGPGRFLVLERPEELPVRLPQVLAGMLR